MLSRPNVTPSIATPTDEGKRSVFIVDDDAALIEALSELLREEGYVVEAFTDAAVALARLEAGERPGVVLLDYLMPRMTGADFLQALEHAGIELPVMLFTAMNESRVQVPLQNVRAMMRKPFELERLLEELARIEGT